LALFMAVNDDDEHTAQIGEWIDDVQLQVSMTEAMVAQFSAPASSPEKRAFS